MKDLRKIISLFLAIFVIGVLVTFFSVRKTLDKTNQIEKVEISQDSISSFSKNKRHF